MLCIKTRITFRQTERHTQCAMYAKRAIYTVVHVCVMSPEYECTRKTDVLTPFRSVENDFINRAIRYWVIQNNLMRTVLPAKADCQKVFFWSNDALFLGLVLKGIIGTLSVRLLCPSVYKCVRLLISLSIHILFANKCNL